MEKEHRNNYKIITNYISNIERYKVKEKEKGGINYKLLDKDINEINPELIKILIKDKLCKELFFDKIEDIYVFNQNSFIEVMFNTNEYMESYTKYSSDIGIFLKDEDKIQLNFPYKDCVLVGGMDKEDDKVNLEVFYNEILERDKINKLFEPKVFHNIKKLSYSKELSEDDKLDNPNNIQIDNDIDNIEFETIEEGGIEKQKLKDNLLIKGNNLLGLHSLAKRLSGSIDVIYIDPPYYFNKTKSSDSFAYNSNFKLSTWLTFMKNRLEIAKELLSDTGVIFISMNEDGNSHLKLLCDDIFGVDNSINTIVWKNTIKRDGHQILGEHEYIFAYAKNLGVQKVWRKANLEMLELYNYFLQIKNTKNIDKNTLENKLKKFIKSDKKYDRVSSYDIYDIETDELISSGNMSGKNKFDIIHPNGKICKSSINGWNTNEEKMLERIKNKSILFGLDEKTVPRLKIFAKDRIYDDKLRSIVNILGDGEGEKLEKDYGFYFSNPKPIELLKLLFSIFHKNSTILDFFAGSGTTAHSVLSLNKEDGGNRKFILLEQMDYIESITSERIKRCMIKEGYEDSFVYMEMKESNTKELKNSIKSSKNKEELISIINDNFDNGYFINIDNKEQLSLKIEDIYKSIAKKSKSLRTLNKAFYTSIGYCIENHMSHNEDYISYKDIEELNKSNQIKDNEYKLNKAFFNN